MSFAVRSGIRAAVSVWLISVAAGDGLSFTPACQLSLLPLISAGAPAPCASALTRAVNDTLLLQACAETRLDCLASPFARLMPPRSAASAGAGYLTGPRADLCPLCNATLLASVESCVAFVRTLTQAGTLPAACTGNADKLALIQLRDQTRITCGTATPRNASAGWIDVRDMTQCSSCATLPCMPGMVCRADTQPRLCPAGFFCPTPGVMRSCPRGSFCPEGSVEPIACRGNAACTSEEADREVVWLPFFFALLFLCCIAAYTFTYSEVPLSNVAQAWMKSARTAAPVSPASQVAATAPTVSNALSPRANTPHAPVPVSIHFTDLSLVTAGKKRLNGITSAISSCRFTAIMGGSGAGKTSLMTVLLGHEKHTGGSISFVRDDTGQALSAAATRRTIGYVPQTDVMVPELTVFETILHSARLRLPPGTTEEQRVARTQDVIAKLRLSKLSDRVVGAADAQAGTAVLSPAERKCVSIAMELVADPSVLFLDEPTSGLDATSSLRIARLVSSLSRSGITCVAVLHQPRHEIFQVVDNLIALATGGLLVYSGPASLACAYLADAANFVAPPAANPADFIIDAIAGKYGHVHSGSNGTSASEQNDTPVSAPLPPVHAATAEPADAAAAAPRAKVEATFATLARLWAESGEARTGRLQAQFAGEAASVVKASQGAAVAKEASAGWWTQLWASFARATVQHLRGRGMLVDFTSQFMGGIVMGIVTSGGPLFLPPLPIMYNDSCPPWFRAPCRWGRRMMNLPAGFYLVMTLGMLVMSPAVRTFGREKAAFLREYRTGSRILPYFLGKALADVPYVAISAFMYISPILIIAPWRAPAELMYAIMFVTGLFINAFGYSLSLALKDPDSASLVGIILAIVMNLFGGFVPVIGGFGYWAYTRYPQRSISAAELLVGYGTTTGIYNQIVAGEYRFPDIPRDLGALFVFALGINALALLLLYRSVLKA